MSRNERILSEIDRLQDELSHLGACTLINKTAEEIAHIDERFFLACEKLNALKHGLQRGKLKG